MIYHQHRYHRADQGIPGPDASRMLRTKFTQNDPKKRIPDPSQGDDPGEFITWLRLLLNLPLPKTAADETTAPDPAVLEAEQKVQAKLEQLIKTKLGSNGDLGKATKVMYDYIRVTAKNPALNTQDGRDKFAEFVASLRAIYTLGDWLNQVMQAGKQMPK